MIPGGKSVWGGTPRTAVSASGGCGRHSAALCPPEECAVLQVQWPVASGQWPVASGQWTVDSGQWTVVSEQWTVDSEQ